MPSQFRFVAACLIGLVGCASVAGAQDPTINYRGGDREMNAAIAEARRTRADFLKALATRSADAFFVKAPIPYGRDGAREHVWMGDVRAEGADFVGEIANEPVNLTNLHKGSTWRLNQAEISDWYFVRNGLLHGAYTLRVMLKRMPPADAERLRKQLAP